MAVNITGNPYVVGSAINTDTIVTDVENVHIKFIYWYKPTTAGHLASIKDKNGNVIIPLYCDVANQCQVWPLWTTFNGIHVDDLDSGTLYIYVG
jgi:hypothetical protein